MNEIKEAFTNHMMGVGFPAPIFTGEKAYEVYS